MFRWSIIKVKLKQLVVNHHFVSNQLKHISSAKTGILYMNKHLRRIFLLLITFAICTHVASAQTTFASEEELKTQAAKLFDDDEFEEAYPLYSQLTSIYPKDPNYNYRLGVCMLFASDDKEKPIPFLEFASTKPDVEKEVFFYLAKAYHLNYRFDDAIKEYTAYKNVASSAKAEKLMVDRQIEMCKNGKKLLHNLTDLVVIEKKEMSRTDFFRSYDISDIGGKLLVKPDEDEFKTSLDKKKKEKSIIYLSSTNNQVFFSSYGDNGDQGKDIYVIRKLPNGEWSKPQTLGYPINTEFDEDYPFLHPNGKVLYFCSKGHNSMGGYDIFKSTLNEETNTWNKPVNLDFPINTPDDDILYVTNADEKEAYFSSARASKSGKTEVYHINVERKPIDIAIIKGAVVKNRDGQALDVKITVKDLSDNEILGIFNAKAANGVYLINIPNGGKFLFTVEAAGFSTQSDIVEVPVQYVFKPMKQEISYETGTDKLIIKNMFDEEMDESSYLLALNFIKEKSKMDVNTNAATNTAATVATKDTSVSDIAVKTTAVADKTKVTPGAKLTNEDIVKIANTDADDVENEAKDIKEQADVALALANQKSELAQNKAKEATQLMVDANSMSDNVKKQATIDEANTASADADELNQETVAAFNLAKKLDFRANSKQEEADLSKQYAKDLAAAVKSKNPGEALAKLDEQQKKLDALSEQNNNPTFVNSLKMDADNKKKDLDKATQTSTEIKQEISDNEKLIVTTQAEADKERNDKVKQGLLDQVAGLKKDTEDSKSDLALNETKVNQLQKDYNGIINETQLVGSVLDKAKTGTSENAAASAAIVDKAKLEQEVNSIKNSTVVASAKTTDNTVKDNSTKTTDVAVKDNTTKTSDVATNTTPTTDNTVKDNSAKTTDIAVKDNATKTSDVVTNTTPVTDNTVKDNTAKTTDVAVSPVTDNAVTPEDYNKKYSDEIAAVDNITNEKERENKKAELYKTWTASINDDLTAKKTELKSEKDKTKKKELNQEIATLEKDLKEKQLATSTALASAEKSDKQDASVTPTSTDNSLTTDNTTTSETPASTNKKYTAELAATDNITNEADRETAKADALKKWSAAIDTDVAKKKQDMDASTDPEMKALLAVKIKDEEQLSKEKQDQANQSVAKADKLKNLTAVVTNATTPATDNTSKATDVAVNTTPPTTDNTVKDNSAKTTDVAITNTTTPTTDNAVKDNVAKTTDVAVNTTPVTTDNTVKDNATKTTDVVQNTTPATDNTVKDNTSKTTEVSKDNTKTVEVSNTQKLTEAIANADKASTDLEKENKKVEAYTNYIAVANDSLANVKADLKTEKNSNKKKELTTTIASIESDLKEKQTALDNSTAKVKALQQPVVVNNTLPTTANTTTPVDTNSTDSEIPQPPVVKQFVYATSSASQEAVKADNLNKEADQLNTQASELKTKAASETNVDDKNADFAKAEELNKQVESKKIESAQLSGTANKTEYTSNQNVLNQLAAASVNNKSDDITIAEMMKDESKIYFDKAQKSRDFAASTDSYEEKQSGLDDAYKNEMIALEKQQKATVIYKKYNQNFVASNNIVAVPETDNTSVKATDNAVVKNATSPVKDNTKTVTPVTDNAVAIKTTDNTKTADATTPVKDSASVVKTADNVDNTTASTKTNETKTSTVPVADNTKSTTVPVTDKTTAKTTDVAKTTATPATTKSVSTEGFVTKSAPVYSAAKPIPVNTKLPEGLVFKVQIGAFRNPIPQDLFKGMSPITGETTPQGFTRYTAGLFTKYSTADKVKDEIRGLGYKDAFVVAFLNGKRISMSEAMAMTGEQLPATISTATTTTTPVVDNTVTTNPSTTTPVVTTTPVTNNTTTKQTPTNPTEIAVTQNVSAVTGLFYTVQVGVFSQPVIAAKLHNVQPLYTETAPNGNLRYNVGIYNNMGRATEAKNMIVDAGIKDAFITAYSSGKRISMTEAAEQEKQGSGVFSTASNINVLPTFSSAGSKQSTAQATTTTKAAVEPKQTPVTTPKVKTEKAATEKQPVTSTEPVTTEKEEKAKPETTTTTTPVTTTVVTPIVKTNIPMPIDSGIVFKVQIGAFKDEVPLDMANKFLIIAKKGIHNYNDENGLTIYSVGVFKTYEEAAKVKGDVATEAAINDAFIVAYNNGVKISVEDAKALINK